MQVNHNSLKRRYKVILTDLRTIPLGQIVYYEKLTYSPALTSISELTLTITNTINDAAGERIPTPFYEELRGDMLLLIDDKDYFYINQCSETVEGELATKTIHAYSREYELSSKSFNNYEPETERFLYFKKPIAGAGGYPWVDAVPQENGLRDFLKEDKDKDGAFFGIFNEIETRTSWRLERDPSGQPVVPEEIRTQTRMITTSETNMLELMGVLQEAWSCYFIYDTKNRVISIRTAEELRENARPVGILSNENFINSFTRELKEEEIKTRLFLYNKDGVGVTAQKVAHGQPYIENYSYFMKEEYMTATLIAAINAYNNNLNAKQAEAEATWAKIKEYIAERQAADTVIKDLENELIAPTTTYERLKSIRDGYTSPDGSLVIEGRKLNEFEQAEMTEVSIIITRITNKIKLQTKGNITGTERPRSLEQIEKLREVENKKLLALKEQAWMSGFFKKYEKDNNLATGSLMSEMEPFIRDATYQSDTIEDADDLYIQGFSILEEISQPHLQFSMSVIDFLSLVEFEDAWGLIELGQVLRIKNGSEFIDDVLFLKYEHSPDDQSLNLEFSNNLKLKSDLSYIADLLRQSSNVASAVSFNSSFWSAGGKGSFALSYGGMLGQIYANEIYAEKIVANEIHAVMGIFDTVVSRVGIFENIFADFIETDVLSAGEIYARLGEFVFLNVGEAHIDKLFANEAFIKVLKANVAFFDELFADEGFIGSLTSSVAFISQLTASTAFIGELVASQAFIDELNTNNAFIRNLEVENGFIDKLVSSSIMTNYLDTKYLRADLAEIDTAIILQAIVEHMIAGEAFVAEFTASIADMITINANQITAGLIVADQILLRGHGVDENGNPVPGVLLALNQFGDITTTVDDSLDGHILTTNSVNADRIMANTITADQIKSRSITAMELAAATITSASGVIGDLSAGHITSGTLDASKVVVANLSANSINTGVLQGATNKFYLDLDQGYFNFGNRLISDATGIRFNLSGDEDIEDYIANRMPHEIFFTPQSESILSNATGELSQDAVFNIDLSIFKGPSQIGATILNPQLQDFSKNRINSPLVQFELIHPTPTTSGQIKVTINKLLQLPTDTGYIEFIVRPEDQSRNYACRVSWVKVKMGEKATTLQITSSEGQVFTNFNIYTELTVAAFKGSTDITATIPAARFSWTRTSDDRLGDSVWNSTNGQGKKTIVVTAQDMLERATFTCTLLD